MITERTVIVQYLEPLMSRELLCKFPDNSAFDFDYSQSSIWSPLLPRRCSMIYDPSMDVQRKLSYGSEKTSQGKLKKLTTTLKKRITTTMMTKRKKGSDLSAIPLKGSTPRKGWNKILKVATKQFKKKTDTIFHMKLSSFLRD